VSVFARFRNIWLVSKDATPPVCKMLNDRKRKHEISKKEKKDNEQRNRETTIDVEET
jgi:translation initiation factor IF-3